MADGLSRPAAQKVTLPAKAPVTAATTPLPAKVPLPALVPPPRGEWAGTNGHPPPAGHPPRRTAAPTRRPVLPLVGALLLGVVLGGGGGGLLGALGGTSVSATALVQIADTPDPGLAALAGAAQSDNALTSFATTEFAWLSGEELPTAVAGRLGMSADEDVKLSVTQVNQSAVASFTGEGATSAEAVRLVKTAVDIYVDRRQESFRTDIGNSLDSVNRTLEGIERPPAETRNQPVDARLERLLALQADLQLLANRDDSGVHVLQPAEPARAGSPSWTIGAVLGAALGGLLAMGALSLFRSRRTTVAGPADAAAVVDDVLHPQVFLPVDWTTRTLPVLQERDQHASELLVAQIAGRRSMTGQVVAVTGASADSPSRAVAALVAVGLARRGPTVLVELEPPVVPHPLLAQTPDATAEPRRYPVPTQVAGLEVLTLRRRPRGAGDSPWGVVAEIIAAGWQCVVLDIGGATEVMRLLPEDCETVMVLGAGIDRKADAAAAAAAVRGRRPLLGVVTRQPWRGRRGGPKPAPRPTPAAAPSPADV
jgi:hypothetical protein